MNLRKRLQRLAQRQATGAGRHPWVVGVDDDGRVVDSGSLDARLWIGKHQAELPFPKTILAGMDVRLALGLDRGDEDALSGEEP